MDRFPETVICTTSTVDDGNMSFRFGDEAEVINNRKQLLEKFSIQFDSHVPMRCTHGDTIIKTSIEHQGPRCQADVVKADVLTTNKPGVALMLLTADCLPVSFFDPVGGVIALAHLSRATTATSLVEKTVKFLATNYGSSPSDMVVNIGPHISASSYCFRKPLTTIHPVIKPHMIESEHQICIDLKAANVEALKKAGIPLCHINTSDIDTAKNNQYFSNYASNQQGDPDGRMATILMMDGK